MRLGLIEITHQLDEVDVGLVEVHRVDVGEEGFHGLQLKSGQVDLSVPVCGKGIKVFEPIDFIGLGWLGCLKLIAFWAIR